MSIVYTRQKIKDNADMTLLACSVPDDDWVEVKRVLGLDLVRN